MEELRRVATDVTGSSSDAGLRTALVEPPSAAGVAAETENRPAEDGPQATSTERPLTPSVSSAVRQPLDRPVPVTDLVDELLMAHSEYLDGWPTTEPAWPADQLSQRAGRWLAEIDPLVRPGERVFGRLAAACLCLVDPAVAAAAQRCGLLAALADGTRPGLVDFLTDDGRRLLRRRAPVAALALGELAPATSLLGIPGEGAARLVSVARQPRSPASGIGRWAASFDRGLYAGRGDLSTKVAENVDVAALGWSARGRLHAVQKGRANRGHGLLRYDAETAESVTEEHWPLATSAAVTEDAVGVIARQRELYWGVTDGGGPLAVSSEGVSDHLMAVAVAGEHIALLADDEVHTRGPDREWTFRYDAGSSAKLTASTDGASIGTDDGTVVRLGWSRDQGPSRRIVALPGTPVEHLVAVGDVTIAAGGEHVAVLIGDAVAARWTTPAEVTAVSLSPDGAALAVGTADLRLRFWRIDAHEELRLTSYSADSPEGEDLLGIAPTVDALAALIAARALAPPLSVGLFGSWGSGKSFFMRQLTARVRVVAEESRRSGRPQRALWAWRNIRQVHFNAWHYASADVWAGLLEQLVRELSSTPSVGLELSPQLAELQRRRIERFTGAKAADASATTSLRAAEERVRQARTEVDAKHVEERQRARAAAEFRDKAARRELTQTVRTQVATAVSGTGLQPLVQPVTDVTTQLAAARRSVDSLRGLVRGGGRLRLILALLLGPVLAVLTALLVHAIEPSLTASAATITWLASTATALAAWLQRGTAWIDQRVSLIETAEASVQHEWEEARSAVRAAELELALAAADVAAAEAEVARAAHQLSVTADGAAASGAGDLLVEYLQGRQSSDDYRSQLGIIGTVRADLEVISDAVDQHNQLLADDDVVNRVVLYIDDLDRCPPDVVVRVLEAVHLLLSYPLFVVVVAVDALWVSKSLATVYPTLLAGGGVTPDNYLEKIFQLPIWLDPPPPEAATAMALALLAPATGRPTTPAAAEPEPRPGADRPDEPGMPSGDPGPLERAVGPARPVDLATTVPQSVTVEEDERLAIGRLAPLLARSPRALKRYLNTYRLLKAVLPAEDLARARLLLAIATGCPDLGERLLDHVAAAQPQASLGSVVDAWPRPEREWLACNIPSGVAWRSFTCGELVPVAAHVRRFVFRTSVGAGTHLRVAGR